MRIRDRRERGERGAVLVEAALVLPVMLTLVLGVVEFGFIWKNELTLTTATRSAARTGSALGRNALADYSILQQLKSSTSALSSASIDKIVVYKANTSSVVPPACLTGGSQAGTCNVYTATDLNRPSSDFNCATNPAAPDAAWCPNTRLDAQASPPDYVGVYVQVNHSYATKLLGNTRTLSEQGVLRIEPTS